MATEAEIVWRGWGEPWTGIGPKARNASVLRCPTCDELYELDDPTALLDATGFGHRDDCFFLAKWLLGVAEGVFDPTGTTSPPGGGGGGGGGGGDTTFGDTDILWGSTVVTFAD